MSTEAPTHLLVFTQSCVKNFTAWALAWGGDGNIEEHGYEDADARNTENVPVISIMLKHCAFRRAVRQGTCRGQVVCGTGKHSFACVSRS